MTNMKHNYPSSFSISDIYEPNVYESSSQAIFQPIDHLFVGEMIGVYQTMSEEQFFYRKDLGTDVVKRDLVKLLVEKLMYSKMIEFTKTTDPFSGEVKLNARIYALPDTKVRILREMKK